MDNMGWFGSYGFYEAADFSAPRRRFWKNAINWCAAGWHTIRNESAGIGEFLMAELCRSGSMQSVAYKLPELLLHEKPVAPPAQGHPRKIAAA